MGAHTRRPSTPPLALSRTAQTSHRCCNSKCKYARKGGRKRSSTGSARWAANTSNRNGSRPGRHRTSKHRGANTTPLADKEPRQRRRYLRCRPLLLVKFNDSAMAAPPGLHTHARGRCRQSRRADVRLPTPQTRPCAHKSRPKPNTGCSHKRSANGPKARRMHRPTSSHDSH